MATVDIKNLNNEVVGKLGSRGRGVQRARSTKGLMHLAVKQYLASQRSGTHKTKTRAEVSGSGKKPWRQKGTGRARVGEIRNPLWRKGGTVFGPQPRDYEYHLPRKMFRAALQSALALKFKDNQLNVVDAFSLDGSQDEGVFAGADEAWIRSQGSARSITRKIQNLWLAARNLGEVQLIAEPAGDALSRC